MSLRVTAVLVEDEREARLHLRQILSRVEWIEVVGEAGDGVAAIELIDRLRPGLVFLDVQLPERSGLDVLQAIQASPEVVFTTAFDQHAVAAFELGALDYLVKPFGEDRLRKALERVRVRLEQAHGDAATSERARATLAPPPLERLFARQLDRIVPIAASEILRVEAKGDYAEVHTAAGAYLMHISLTELAARLDAKRFQRVHRSHIVNLDAVQHIQPHDDRRLEIVLADGSSVIASREASERLRGEAR